MKEINFVINTLTANGYSGYFRINPNLNDKAIPTPKDVAGMNVAWGTLPNVIKQLHSSHEQAAKDIPKRISSTQRETSY